MMKSAIDAWAVEHPAGAELAPHAHEHGQLLVLLRGTMAISSEAGWWVAPPGLAIWVPPGVEHGARYSELSRLLNLNFGQPLVERMPTVCMSVVVTDLLRELALEAVRLGEAREASDGRGDRTALPPDRRERALADASEPFEEGHEVAGAHAPSDASELIARLMVLQIGQPQPGPGLFVPHGRDRRLQQAIALLRQDPGSHISLDALAAQVHTSNRTLTRLFVNETGMPFTRWREHLRVVCAVEKLARGRSITQTAFELGYQSTSSFTVLFTRLLGLPPRRYMRHYLERGRAES